MQNGYGKGNENIYLRCRKEAAKYNERLNSREGAAEFLGISVSSLANYELGITKVVPPDMVVMMADLYNAPQLKAHYCAYECLMGQGSPIATEINSIELVTVKIMQSLSGVKLEKIKEQLIEIAADGIVSESEVPALQEIVNYLNGVAQTIGELSLICQKCLGSVKNAQSR